MLNEMCVSKKVAVPNDFHCNEPSDFKKVREFRGQLSDCHFRKKEFAPWSWNFCVIAVMVLTKIIKNNVRILKQSCSLLVMVQYKELLYVKVSIL
jgi:hypothetical protein